MMSADLINKVNQQIKAELQSAYLYLAMSAYCDKKNFNGFAHWLQKQSEEEYSHAMKFYHHLLDRGAEIELKPLDAPAKEYGSFLSLFEQVLAHEKKVTALIEDIYEAAKKGKDYPLELLLHWFIQEQVEEEATASYLVETLRMIGDKPQGLLMFDRELAKR